MQSINNFFFKISYKSLKFLAQNKALKPFPLASCIYTVHVQSYKTQQLQYWLSPFPVYPTRAAEQMPWGSKSRLISSFLQ